MPRLVEDSVTPDTGLSCLTFMLRFMGHGADPEQLRHDQAVRGRAMGTLEILRAAKRLGLKARSVTTRWDRLAAIPLPAIAKRRDGRYFIIAKIDGDRVLIQDPLDPRPLMLPRAVVEPAWSGELVLMARRAGLDLAQVRFGIGWFVPALLKYRRLFTEILLASFMLQVFGLISPLFFQVVVDKVLAHRSLTTLDILVIGLVVVSLFETVLGGLRSYLFSHTTSRVDVTLGARLFEHLLALPLPYFQARRVGDNVARVRELDRIRDFLTGSALTLVIDLVFTVVFLAVMWWYSPALTGIVLASLPAYAAISLVVTPIPAPAAGSQVRPWGGEPGVSGRKHLRHRDAEGDGGGARDAPPLGGAARGLRRRRLPCVQPGGGRRAGRPARQQTDDGCPAVCRRTGGDRRRADHRRAGGGEHAGGPGFVAGAADGPAVERLPAGAGVRRTAGRHPQHHAGAGGQARPPAASRNPRPHPLRPGGLPLPSRRLADPAGHRPDRGGRGKRSASSVRRGRERAR